MKCPSFETGRGAAYEPIPPYSRECLKGDCAWWDETMRKCKELSELDVQTDILRVLRLLHEDLYHISVKGEE